MTTLTAHVPPTTSPAPVATAPATAGALSGWRDRRRRAADARRNRRALAEAMAAAPTAAGRRELQVLLLP